MITGLFTHIKNRGWVEDWSPTAGFTIADFDSMNDQMRAAGVNGGKVLILGGHKVTRGLETLGYAGGTYITAVSGGEQLVREFYDGIGSNNDTERAMAINLSFTGFVKGGYSYGIQTLDSMSDPEFLGVSPSRLDRTAFVIPMENVDVLQGNLFNKLKMPNIALVHPSMDSYNRGIRKIWQDGAEGTPPNGDVDIKILYARQSLGLQVMCASHMGILNPLN
jgi:hypothetical protein